MRAAKIIFLVVLMALAIGPAPAPAEDGDAPLMVLVAPQQGPLARFGREAINGADLALKDLGGGLKLTVVDEAAQRPDDFATLAREAKVVAGYFTESRLISDAPLLLFYRRATLLPFLTTAEAASRGSSFFRLMPTYGEQGQFLAMRVLAMKKRPRRLLIIQGAGMGSMEMAAAFQETLAEPLAPPPPEAAPGRRPKKSAPVKPLDKNAQVATIGPDDDLKATGLDKTPELIILAVTPDEAAGLAPRLGAAGFSKVPIWGGSALGFREVGAAFNAFRLKLSLALPIDLSKDTPPALADFKRDYIIEYKNRPTWIAALAYDTLNLAIKAVSATAASGEVAAFLNGHSHHALGQYQLAPSGGGRPPLALMAVGGDTLGYLP